MTFFNYDNYLYRKVYGRGPLEDREPLYHSQPFFIEVNGQPGRQSVVGVLIDNPGPVLVDVGVQDSLSYRFGTRFGDLNYYIFLGDNLGDVVSSHVSLVGRARLKPRYALGYHQGCYGYDTKDKVMAAAKAYREADVPLDGIHIDVDIQNNYKTFTIDEGKFSQPKQMFSDLRQLGIKCSTNITPLVSNQPPYYQTYTEGLVRHAFVTDERDAPVARSDERYQNYNNGWESYAGLPPGCNYNNGEPYVGQVNYGGNRACIGHYPDFGQKDVRVWWGEQYQYLFDTGLEMVWQDMTTPAIGDAFGDMCSFPFKLLLTNDYYKGGDGAANYPKSPAITIWNLYSANLYKATYHGLNNLKGRENKRNFIVGRGSHSRSHRYAALWTGDNASTWDFLRICVPQVLALGLSAQAMSGADVGGFGCDVDWQGWQQWIDPELLMRWTLMGAFLPWFRNHYVQKGQKLFQEPYAYQAVDARVLPICRYYIQLRYRLLQLFYDAMFENTLNGMPICRPLMLTDPTDTALYNGQIAFVSTHSWSATTCSWRPFSNPSRHTTGTAAGTFTCRRATTGTVSWTTRRPSGPRSGAVARCATTTLTSAPSPATWASWFPCMCARVLSFQPSSLSTGWVSCTRRISTTPSLSISTPAPRRTRRRRTRCTSTTASAGRRRSKALRTAPPRKRGTIRRPRASTARSWSAMRIRPATRTRNA